MNRKNIAPLTIPTRTLGIRRPVPPSILTVLSREVGSVLCLIVCFWSLDQISPLAKLVFDERFTTLSIGWQLWIYVNEIGWLLCVAGIVINSIAVTGKVVKRMEPHQARARNRSLAW
ncbi:MAG TPA: hypothetical protein VFH06_02690 [Candidatus Saccharimonadales bacterium]|nr:hypothetical protein [Candidatus Saccharimonadales bacterium]